MAIRNILTREDPALYKPSRLVTNFDKRLHILLDDLADTLREAQGAGLAAPQVGVLRRVCIVELDDDDGLVELVNPEIVSAEGEKEGREGCLSIPGVAGIVTRPARVTIRARDRRGNEFVTTAEGLRARACCHEIDHLDGKLYTEKVTRYLSEEEMAEAEEE